MKAITFIFALIFVALTGCNQEEIKQCQVTISELESRIDELENTLKYTQKKLENCHYDLYAIQTEFEECDRKYKRCKLWCDDCW
jgi:predicted  nucleic acid-binding Zn-ribbon protein